jgi:hypothetical protein
MFPSRKPLRLDVYLLRRSAAVVVEGEGRKRQAKEKENQCTLTKSTLISE